MTGAPLVARWVAGDATQVSLALTAALGIEVRPGRRIAIPGLLLEITAREPRSPGGPGDRLEIVVAHPPSGAAPAGEDRGAPAQPPGPGEQARAAADDSGARLLALGWATVDLDRAAAGWPGVAWVAAPRDALLGARALVGELDPAGWHADRTGTAAAAPTASSRTAASSIGTQTPSPTRADMPAGPAIPDMRAAIAIVLLEPDTEGRVAATLARHGEGPAALYITQPAAAFSDAVARLALLGVRVSAGSGPFGAAIAVVGAPASSPTLVLVSADDPATPVDRDTGRQAESRPPGPPARKPQPGPTGYHRAMIERAKFTFRDAGPDDAEWIAGLLSDEGYPAGATDIVRRLERYVQRECPVRIAEAGGERAGFVACQVIPRFEHDDHVIRVMALVVDPGVRGRGAGAALMAEAEHIAEEIDAAFLEVTAGHHRPAALRLFEAAGYDPSLTTYLRKRR